MRIILACRDSPASHYIAGCLARRGLLDALIVESGKIARRNKVRRMLRQGPPWKLPGTLLDLLFLYSYQLLQEQSLRGYVAAENSGEGFPGGIERLDVDDINDMAVMDFLRPQKPDYLVVCGTSILKADLISIPLTATLNIHGGLVPKYRNVHSDLWAYVAGDYENIGSSVLLLDEGIDTGDIVCQAAAGVVAGEGLFAAKKKNLALAGELIVAALTQEQLMKTRQAQDKKLQRFYPTPGVGAFLRLMRMSVRERLRRR